MGWVLAGCVLWSALDRAGLPLGLMAAVGLLRDAPGAMVGVVAACAVAGALGDLGCYALGARWLRAAPSAPSTAPTGWRARVRRWVRPVQSRTAAWLCLSKTTLPVNLAVATAAGVLGYGPVRTFGWCLLGSLVSMSAWAAVTWFGLQPLLALPPAVGVTWGVVLLGVFVLVGRRVDRRLAAAIGDEA